MRFAPRWAIPLPVVLVLAAGAAWAADQCGNADLSALTSRIYVSPAGTDGDSCGTSSSAACQSIQRGIDRCGGPGCGVLVRYGLYTLTDSIRLKDAVSVYGRCVFGSAPDRKYRSVIEAPPDGKPAITAAGINAPTLLDGVFVKGSDATSPGGASIAMTVSNSTALTIRNSTLSSGKGADGAPGQAFIGNSGGGGTQPNWQQAGPGGAGGQVCPSSGSSLAGRGGDGGPGTWNKGSGCFLECACSNNNDPTGQAGQDSGDVKGGGGGGGGHQGPGCSGSGHETVGDGGPGGPGNPGSCGAVGGTTAPDIWGELTDTAWHPGLGGNGMAGSTGSGGGGGGGGGACTYYTEGGGWRDDNGLPGGGGGGGGCGGGGGQGGQQGGASFPIVIYASMLTDWHSNTLVPGPGGQGGAGAFGSPGGPGGSGVIGAQGRTGFRGCPGSGGQGGDGGRGGAGGGGAGGNGGPSVGIALVGGAKGPDSNSGIYASQPGQPGSKGLGGRNATDQCKGVDGADGVAGGGKDVWNHVFQYGPEGYGFCATAEDGTCSFSGIRNVAYGANGRFVFRTVANGIACNKDTFGSDPIAGTAKACYIGPEEYAFCAAENGTCSFSGIRNVAYGANGQFFFRTVANGIACNNGTFGGDPIAGTVKACYIGPEGYAFCAGENGTCSFSGTKNVAYGANGQFFFRTVANGIACNNGTFGGDPIFGTPKACYIGPAGYEFCVAAENGTCSFSGTKTVAYGANGKFFFRTVANGIACNKDAFGGDPIVGTMKACYISPEVYIGPQGYAFCAGENGTCSFSGTKNVAYGANGQFSFRTVANGIACNNGTFGSDPISGTPKACYLK